MGEVDSGLWLQEGTRKVLHVSVRYFGDFGFPAMPNVLRLGFIDLIAGF